MTVLVTGATGFLGLRFCKLLTEQGQTIRATLRLVPGGHSKASVLENMGVELAPLELNDPRALGEAMEGVRTVYHLAWKSNRGTPGPGQRGAVETADKFNLEAMRVMIDCAQAAKVERFVFSSTISVYGPSSEWGPLPRKESDARADLPLHRYAHFRYYGGAKFTAEEMLRKANPSMDYVILRPALVYGAGARFAQQVINNALNNNQNQQPADPVQWVHVDDVARALLLSGEVAAAKSQTLNVAGRGAVLSSTISNELRRLALEQPETYPPLDWNMRVPQFDITAAEHVLGFLPSVDLREGLKEMVKNA